MSSSTSPECGHPTLTTRAVSASASTAAGMVLLTSTSPIVSMSTSSSTASVTTPHQTTSVLSSSSSSTTSTTSSGPRSSTTPPLSRSSSHQTRINHDWYIGTSIDFESQFKDLLDKRCALGIGSVRDFLKNTPRKSISAVDLEERLYKTWHHGRIVLVGDGTVDSQSSKFIFFFPIAFTNPSILFLLFLSISTIHSTACHQVTIYFMYCTMARGDGGFY